MMRGLPVLLVCVACQRPPETPDGLDQSLRYLFGAFYGSDEEVSAGLSGLVDWYEDEGRGLLGESASLDNIGSFALEPLRQEDVDAYAPRPDGDPATATGVIAVAELPCAWKRAERLLIRPDQDVVFTDFDFYERSYTTSRAAYDGARQEGEYVGIDAPFDLDALQATPEVLLLTENRTSGTEMGVTIPFDLHMHARHGRFSVADEEAQAGLYVTWMPERAEAEGGANTMEQSYTFEVDLEWKGQTLWVYASWAEVQTSVFASDSTILMTAAANTAQDTARRMADICTGDIVLD
jgi:hypothetical protein